MAARDISGRVDPDFLDGGGEMGARIRAHDWSSSPLGDPETWPQSLRSVVGLLLNSRFPMFVAWGEELGFLYNDPYAEILGAKHPRALGRPFHDIWSEIWSDISPLVDAAMAGEATYRENLPLLMDRKGYDEQTWFTFSYSPVRDESGAVAGIFCACTETTEAVLRAKRRSALLELDDRLRDDVDTAALSFAASEVLGEVLGAGRVGYGAVDGEAGTIAIERTWYAPPFRDVSGIHSFADFGSYIDELRRGEAVANTDVEKDSRTAAHADAFRALGIRAHLDVPVVENEEVVGQMFVHSATPRVWTADEIAFVREFAERTRAAIARRAAEQELRHREAALRESDERLRLATENAEVGFWDVEESHGRLIWPPRTKAMFGISADVPVTMDDFYAGLHPDDLDAVGVAYAAAADPTRRALYDVEYRTIGKEDGLLRWVAAKGRGVFDGDGPDARCIRVAGTAVEITDRKEAEQALRESEARLRAALDASESGTFRWDIKTNELTWDEALDRLFGLVPGTTAQNLEQFVAMVHPDDRAGVIERCRRCADQGADFDMEFRVVWPDGTQRWLLDRGKTFLDSAGKAVFMTGACVDVTNRRIAEDLLRKRSEEFFALADNIPALAWMAYANGDIFWYNRRWYEYTGTTPETQLGWGWESVHDPDVLPAVAERWTHSIETATAFEMTFPLKGADGIFRPFLTRIVPIRNEHDELVRWFGTNVDVSDQKRAEDALRELNDQLESRVSQEMDRRSAAEESLRQAQKMEAMGQLTGGVAHDFNNLLTPIVGALDMAQRKGLGGEREQRLISGAAQSADRAKTLVQRLLAFARRQPLQAVSVDVAQLIGAMGSLVSSTTGPQIKVVVEAPDGLPPAKADPNQLEMALLNLAVNARDAMPEGGTLRISASAERIDPGQHSALQAGAYVRLSVADTGCGMDEATLARAVEPFFSTKGVGKGTGLGLSMVHGLASQLGGALSIQSRVGLGTNIELWLPESATRPDQSEPSTDTIGTRQAHGTVLLVDDEELVRASTADMLAELGYAVVEARSAEEALRLVDGGQQLDVLVTDHLMPGMSGVELARELRGRRPDARTLVVSGYADVDGVAPDLPRLVKPFRKADLGAKLSELDEF